MQVGESVPVRISGLELAKRRYPGALVTSGAGQDYLRCIDRVAKGGLLLLERGWSCWRLVSHDDSVCYTMTEAEARRVVRDWPAEA